MDYLLLIVGLVLLTVCADWLTKGCVGMAARFRVPEFVVGLTVALFMMKVIGIFEADIKIFEFFEIFECSSIIQNIRQQCPARLICI